MEQMNESTEMRKRFALRKIDFAILQSVEDISLK